MIIFGTTAYIITLVLIVRRKDFQPLKSQCTSLLFVSTLGNYFFFSALMYNKILQNNLWPMWNGIKHPIDKFSAGTETAIKFSCFMSNAQLYLFRAIWGFPYFFRALRLKLIWGIQKSYFVDQNEDEHGG